MVGAACAPMELDDEIQNMMDASVNASADSGGPEGEGVSDISQTGRLSRTSRAARLTRAGRMTRLLRMSRMTRLVKIAACASSPKSPHTTAIAPNGHHLRSSNLFCRLRKASG